LHKSLSENKKSRTPAKNRMASGFLGFQIHQAYGFTILWAHSLTLGITALFLFLTGSAIVPLEGCPTGYS
jgi:hypothetical protein